MGEHLIGMKRSAALVDGEEEGRIPSDEEPTVVDAAELSESAKRKSKKKKKQRSESTHPVGLSLSLSLASLTFPPPLFFRAHALQFSRRSTRRPPRRLPLRMRRAKNAAV